MRVRTLEIRWHDSPIYSLDYQTLSAPQLRKILAPRIQRDPASSLPSPTVTESAQTAPPTFRLATSGGDNLVRVRTACAHGILEILIVTFSTAVLLPCANLIGMDGASEYFATFCESFVFGSGRATPSSRRIPRHTRQTYGDGQCSAFQSHRGVYRVCGGRYVVPDALIYWWLGLWVSSYRWHDRCMEPE
jgi:hypothetical protein